MPTTNTNKLRRIAQWVLIISVGSVIAYGFLVILPWAAWLTSFLEWVESLGHMGNFVLAFAFVVISFPFTIGYIPLSLSAGYLYGVVWGTLTSMVGSVFGAFLCFMMFRYLFVRVTFCNQMLQSNSSIKKFMSTRSDVRISSGSSSTDSGGRLDLSDSQNGAAEGPTFVFALLIRMMPFPFGFCNALFAMTPITWKTYLVTTWIGLTPFQIMWVYLGTTLRSLTDAAQGNIEGSPGQMVSLALQLLAGVAVPVYLCYRQRSKAPQNVPEITDLSLIIDERPASDQLSITSLGSFSSDPYSPFSGPTPALGLSPPLGISSDTIVLLQDNPLHNHRRTNSQDISIV